MSNSSKIGRNSKCHCRSGEKFKNCCIDKVEREMSQAPMGASIGIFVASLGGAAALLMYKGVGPALAAVGGGVITALAVYIFRDPNPPTGSGGSDSSSINFGR
ncbi:MAG: hypothetical protein GY811_02615 [Myxococcales bacterium]|nr:hypothetical protein [Myxococcales bacterium]